MMSQLNFKVLVVLQEEDFAAEKETTISLVKDAVERCGLKVTTIDFCQLKKIEDEDYPEIEELALQVQAEVSADYPDQKKLQYEEFCNRWRTQSLPHSYIELYGDDCFPKSKRSHHIDWYTSFSFGTLPHNEFFYKYASVNETVSDSVHLVEFYHDTRNVVIHYTKQKSDPLVSLELRFSYENVRNVFVNIKNEPCEIFLDLFNPPLIFRVKLDKDGNEIRSRTLTFMPDMYGKVIETDILGRSNVLHLSFKYPKTVEELASAIHYNCCEKSIYYSNISCISSSTPADPILKNMHFGCAYLITAIFKRNFSAMVQSSNIPRELQKLCRYSEENPDSLERALISVLAAVDSGKILNIWNAIEQQYHYYRMNRNEIEFQEYLLPSKCFMIRRIVLTPTRQLLWPPEIMMGNRILRNFDAGYSMRVSFREDNMLKLSHSLMEGNVLDSCVKKQVETGIRIGSRFYEFLAWSNSQIRDHGIWMYASDKQGKTAADIRQWMGDFSHIHNVPRYMARMGQSFSQTEDTLSIPLDPQYVRTQSDIEGGFDPVNHKPYCFSDGIGKISSELASKIHDALGHDKHCSAFQIRYGGYKGMLVTDPTLKAAQIVFRNSMKKFDSPHNIKLEIAKVSAPVSAQLNRPFIAILNDLGVRHRTFLRLQEEMLKTLTDMLFDEKTAFEFLKSKTPTSLLNFEDISRSGIYLTTEPFFKSLLLALHRHHIDYIKRKANIFIDPSKGRNMLGVLDETGILEYGEVFVQYSTDILSNSSDRETTVLRGDVLVTKNPCVHPGDVRKFVAVDVPDLHHIVDCIVFPQKGPRPHPNEMAGSDLDGDEYLVIWFEDLIFHGPNREPGNFHEVRCPDVPSVTVERMIDFLQSYIENDRLGYIANAHLAQADQLGVESEECVEIAEIFSTAVDFAKTGVSGSINRDLRPRRYPDFMEKDNYRAYKSRKALGKMYRVCRDYESENQESSITYMNVTIDPDLIYPGWENYKEDAIKARDKYNGLLRSVFRNYGIQHEAEALSGAFTNLHCRFHERRDRHEIQKVILGCITKLWKTMFNEFMEEFLKSGDVVTTSEGMLQKASAWYVMTYSDPDALFLSFPWTVSKFLSNIKIKKTMGKSPPFSPAVMRLEEKILECESKGLLIYCEDRYWFRDLFEYKPEVVKRALLTLILWAEEEEIIEASNPIDGHTLYRSTFIKIFLHVAKMFKYVVTFDEYLDDISSAYSSERSSSALCLEFLKFCASLRFYNRYEIKELLSFSVYKHSKLAKKALVSYHRFALSGIFQNLYVDTEVEKELIRMKPVYIDSIIFYNSPIPQSDLERAEDALISHSKVAEVRLREIRQTKRVCVSARGSEEALKSLKTILRKKYHVLRKLFGIPIRPRNPPIELPEILVVP